MGENKWKSKVVIIRSSQKRETEATSLTKEITNSPL